MSGFNAISAVSKALELMLSDELTQVGQPMSAQLHLLQTPPAAPLLTIFLYDVAEDATVRNRAPVETVGPDGVRRIERPPIPLILRYMITPWGTDPDQVYRMLGCTVAALQDSRNVLGQRLRDYLAGPGGVPASIPSIGDLEVLSLTMAHLTLDEKSRIWWAIQQPFHLSLIYELRLVEVDRHGPPAVRASDVLQRVVDSRLPEAVL